MTKALCGPWIISLILFCPHEGKIHAAKSMRISWCMKYARHYSSECCSQSAHKIQEHLTTGSRESGEAGTPWGIGTRVCNFPQSKIILKSLFFAPSPTVPQNVGSCHFKTDNK